MHETLPENPVLDMIAHDLLAEMSRQPNWSEETVGAPQLLTWLLVAAAHGMQRHTGWATGYSRSRVALCWLSLFATLPEAWQGLVCERISNLETTPFDGGSLVG